MNSELHAPTAIASFDASVVITTRNRRIETLRSVSSCLAQERCRVEVLVFDDASEDGTVEALRQAFPSVRVFETSQRKGYIHNRNRGFQEALAPIIFSIDDDAYFSDPDIIAQTLCLFAEDVGIAAVAIPYIEPMNVRSKSSLKTPFCASPGDSLRGFVGCSHALRRDVVLSLGAYREYFVHQGEERDLCLRMMAEGWRIVYGSSGLIVHMVSPKRQAARVVYYGARNRLLFDILNLPLSKLLLRLLWDPLAIIRYRFAWVTLFPKMRGVCAGLIQGVRHSRDRRPVSRHIYEKFVSLPSHGPVECREPIPPPCVPSTTASFG